ncbi:MAG TPA: hypothetical protein VGM77_03340 [Gemmatimonadales bacterium]|jgi:hypothetical protein
MSHATAADIATPSKARLWIGVGLAPAAWSVAEVVGYIGAGRGCWGNWADGRTVGPSNSNTWVLVIGGVALLTAAIGLAVAVGNYRRTSSGRSDEARAHFMATVGTAGSVLFLSGIVLFLLPPLFLHACVATR